MKSLWLNCLRSIYLMWKVSEDLAKDEDRLQKLSDDPRTLEEVSLQYEQLQEKRFSVVLIPVHNSVNCWFLALSRWEKVLHPLLKTYKSNFSVVKYWHVRLENKCNQLKEEAMILNTAKTNSIQRQASVQDLENEISLLCNECLVIVFPLLRKHFQGIRRKMCFEKTRAWW